MPTATASPEPFATTACPCTFSASTPLRSVGLSGLETFAVAKPPVSPSKIVGVGLNYRAHALEMGKPLPEEPLMFLKPLSALIGPGEPIVRPAGCTP